MTTTTSRKETHTPLQGFHFASDGVKPAAYIEATTIAEATQLFKKGRTSISTPSAKDTSEVGVQ